MYRTLDTSKLLGTAEQLTQRIKARFPDAGLADVSAEVTHTLRDAAGRAEKIAQPNIPLRVTLIGLLLLIVVGSIASVVIEGGGTLGKAWYLLDSTRGALIYVALFLAFCWTLETRFKRHKAIKAIHEARALVHVVDMYQLAKDPESVADGSAEIGGRSMNAESMSFYLQFCTELLSLVSKIGHLYVQNFPDATALTAADQVETLATGLSHKIWQKIMILQRIRSEQDEAAPLPLPQKG